MPLRMRVREVVMRLQKGSFIKLRAFGGRRIVRRFICKQNASVLICSDEEYRLAARERRPPLCVGFPIEDVIGKSVRNLLKSDIQYSAIRASKQVRVIRGR